MAKKKKRNKEVGKQHELPGGFWRQVFALILIVLAVLLVITWFGSGGDILYQVHEGGLWAIGYAIYLLPLLLVYLGVSIFRSDDNKLPVVVWGASILMVVWFSGVFGVPTVDKDVVQTGGVGGEWLNGLVKQLVEPGVAILIYVVLILITILFVLSVSPLAMFRAIGRMLRVSKRQEDEENAKVARKADEEPVGDIDIKVNSGVAVAEPSGKKRSETKAAEKQEPKSALMAISDPNWKMPPVDLLEKKQSPADAGNIQQNALIIKNTLGEFGIDVEMEGANIGPRVTQYTMRPPSGVNLSKIVGHDKELALNLAADKIRVEAPIPGTKSVGVEIPNVRSADVRLRSVLESKDWSSAEGNLVFAVGKDILGRSVVADLAKMPHLLIAGTTGSGKSVMMNTLLMSLLYRNSPSDMKLVIVDPKQVEMAQYVDVPHLLTPIITAPDKTLSAMKWAVDEMEKRYKLMSEERVKNISDYNAKIAGGNKKVVMADESGDEHEYDGGKMPYIVIVVDEMADLMMMAGKDLEMLIVRVAQKGRAAGVHLVLATQRPEVKIITGLIKANISGRIAFAVGSQIDSRVMLDMMGAEKLLGKGDMLFLTTEMMGKPQRIQGAWASDDDINKVTDFLRDQSAPQYDDDVVSQQVRIKGMGGVFGDSGGGVSSAGGDEMRQVAELAVQSGKLSTSLIQRRLHLGYGRAAAIIDDLEMMGVVGPANGNRPRDVLISSMDEYPE